MFLILPIQTRQAWFPMEVDIETGKNKNKKERNSRYSEFPFNLAIAASRHGDGLLGRLFINCLH